MPFDLGMRVRLLQNPGRGGGVIKVDEGDGEPYVKVRFDDGSNAWHPASELEVPQEEESRESLFVAGRFGDQETLRRHLVFHKLNGRLADVIYSMGTTATDYYPHQFKPVLRFLDSPARGLLIADEVGLGKTIEAGLLWTEWKARFDARRLVVVCPPHLRENWIGELDRRFGVRAVEANAEVVVEELSRARGDRQREFVLVTSYQSLLPPRGWNDLPNNHPNPRVRLAHLVESANDEEPLVDMMVFDEAHYLRNSESRTSYTGRILAGVADRLVLLSATPIMLKNENLWVLLNLLDPDTFDSSAAFNELIEANAPLVRARDLLLGTTTPDSREIADLLCQGMRHRLMEGNRQLRAVVDLLTQKAQLADGEERWDAIQSIERASLLAHVVNRTRKRDVQANRVVRMVRTFRVDLGEHEARFYEAVTRLVREYCAENVQQGAGLLYVMPQRQVSSSIPASLQRWLRNDSGDDWDALDAVDRITSELDEEQNIGPLTQYLIDNALELGSRKVLERDDSKFQLLAFALQQYFTENPAGKVVLFAFFRDTLTYLKTRLERLDVRCALIRGGMGKEKYAQIDWFSKPDGPSVLLSSEVGSEGLNLQFASLLINYDLPWNPMRIEQRIGRLDRIGQRAEQILIWNFVAGDTIDERIYERLFLRLGVFEKGLGTTEEVLGDEIGELTRDLFRHTLTPEQEAERIDRTAAAIANRDKEAATVEENAGNLAAYQDFILKRVNACQDLSRTVDSRDIESYVCDYFRNMDPESRMQGVDHAMRRFRLTLNPDTAYKFEQFCQIQGMRTRSPFSAYRPTVLRFANSTTVASGPAEEVVNQIHPLVRFITAQIVEKKEGVLPVVAVRAPAAECGIDPADYAFVVERWSLAGLRDFEKLYFAAVRMSDGRRVADEDAERMVMGAAYAGSLWLDPASDYDLPATWEGIEARLLDSVFSEFRAYKRKIQAENEDRIDLQRKLVENHNERKSQQLKETIERHRSLGRRGLVAATEGQLKKLENRTAMQIRRLEEKRKMSAMNSDVCVGVVRVL